MLKFFASIFWALLALVATGGIAVATSVYFFPLKASKLDLAAGETLFSEGCSGCHSNVEGQISGMGPNLHGIGLHAADRVEGQSSSEYILESILYPEKFIAPGSSGVMPAGTVNNLETDEIRSLVAYLVASGGSVDYAEIAALDINVPEQQQATDEFSVAEMRAGWHLFSRELGCIACHSIYEEPGSALIAPSLEKGSQLPVDYVLESIREPAKHIADSYLQRTYTLKNGTTINGRLQVETDTSYRIYGVGADGRRRQHTLEKSEVVDEVASDVSPMPPYSLSAEQERNLIAFLHSLQGGGH